MRRPQGRWTLEHSAQISPWWLLRGLLKALRGSRQKVNFVEGVGWEECVKEVRVERTMVLFGFVEWNVGLSEI